MHEIHDEKTYPLSSSQREIWFDQALHPDIPLYNIGGYSRIDGPLEHERLERAVNLVAARHDALRIVLEPPSGDGLPCQRFMDRIETRVPFHNFSGEKLSLIHI